MAILQTLARSVSLHRREGGVLDTLPAQHQGTCSSPVSVWVRREASTKRLT
jgi:hypothetical protein